ncbi:MAG TPA: nuclear transport factor 2 family protein [Candidatus Udaeobacter sp.]|nr:nuclear transport factor 2 family protein [Candidatus Udaeobacter sp.]
MKQGINQITILRLAFAVAVCLRLSAVWLQAQATASGSKTSEGEKLERQMASDIQAKNWTAVEARIAEGFQSVHPDGVRDRAGEIALLKKMNFGAFTLSDFKSNTIGDNIVVTFTMTVAETIDSKQLPAKPAYRLSVWKKGVNGWQWISHANFTPIR